jgi:hypothetical protein
MTRGHQVHKYGKLPAQPARPHLKLSPVLAELPTPPISADWQSNSISWPMYANDTVGDCTCAAVGHVINQLTFYGAGAEYMVTTAHVLAMYSAITGYNPKDSNSDTGAYCQDVLAYWRKTGIEGHKIVAYAALDPSNLTEVKQAINAFGSVYIGFSVTQAAEDAFDAGKVWDVKKGSPNLGGHCVPVGAFNSTTKRFGGVTWAEEFEMTEAYWKQNVDEAWVVLDQDGLNKALEYFAGSATFYDLGQIFAALTGETNPVPVPDPTPTPTPPAVVDDATMWANAKAWAAAKGFN